MEIRQFWRDTLAQDADAMRRWFRPDAAVYWHCANEKFTVDEFIRANCEYPGERDGRVERAERLGDRIITGPMCFPETGLCCSMSFPGFG